MLKRLRTLLKPALLTLVIASLLAWWIYGGSSGTVKANLIDDLDSLQTYAEDSYQNYVNQHAGAGVPDSKIVIRAADEFRDEGGNAKILTGFEGAEGPVLQTGDTGTVTWRFDAPDEGLYRLQVRYYTIPGKSSAIERSISLDGKLPFAEASSVTLARVWANATGRDAFKKDNRGNEIRPSQIEVPSWMETEVKDAQGLYAEPFSFYLTKGAHTLSLTGLREPVVLDTLTFGPESRLPAYADLQRQYEAEGYGPAPANALIKVQGENAARKSSPTLYPVSDHSSPATEPYDVSKIRLNAVGGYNWRMPGQWVEWDVDVQQGGLYKLALKVRQDQLRGLYSNRKLTIDGAVPFKEAEALSFHYSANWQMVVPGFRRQDGAETPYEIYLAKGKHTIRLEAELGDVAELVRTVQSSMLEINRIYRKILVITSSDPDPFRDYQLGRRIPEMADTFRKQSDILYSVAEKLRGLTGEKSDKTAILYLLSKELREFADNADGVPPKLKQFKTDMGSLGTWLLTVREMPLQVDYLTLSAPDAKLQKAGATLGESIVHNAEAFGYSFVTDYNSIGDAAAGGRKLKVWIGTGRDQAQVVKQMIDDTFTPEMKIGIDLKLVDMSILLSATLAGQGPDVAMMVGGGDPVNYAMRGASYDLTKFADYGEVASRFEDSASKPYRFGGGAYGLPEQQVFDVMFYRKDILEELGLKVPSTWDDVYKLLPNLKKNNMDFGLPIVDTKTPQAAALPINEAYAMLLYQAGGSFYKEDGTASNLDTEVGMSKFREWTELYTDYKFPVDYDFVNRFRLGEVPIGVAPYTTYNTLAVFAPEIRGQWGFTLVPGTKQKDGTIDRSVASNGTATMMLSASKDKEAAWTFMKWWTDKETQVRFGREMESLMGESARYPTANIEALSELPWPVADFETLQEQRDWVKGIPEVPGGYFTGRILDNAFRKVINAGENPRDALYDQVVNMNNEIAIKREEFGLPAGQGGAGK